MLAYLGRFSLSFFVSLSPPALIVGTGDLWLLAALDGGAIFNVLGSFDIQISTCQTQLSWLVRWHLRVFDFFCLRLKCLGITCLCDSAHRIYGGSKRVVTVINTE